jgi:membrane associated rhomboid family serine protease
MNRPSGFPQLPLIVKNLIIINVLVFLLRMGLASRGVDLDNALGLHYWQSPLFRWWQPFTHMFMHGGIGHIFFNMFALYMFGSMLENLWGPKRFLIFYIVCGLGAAFCHMGVLTFEYTRFYSAFLQYQQHPSFVEYAQFIRHQHIADDPTFNSILTFWSANPACENCAATSILQINQYYSSMLNQATVGASGAVFGLLFAFGYLFPNTELLVFPLPFPVKAKWVVGIYALIELSQGLYNSAGDNIAHFAHLGGMLFAFILLRIWNNKIRSNFY